MNREVMFSSKTDEWSTPQAVYDELDKEFGFTLDPCATDENHKCKEYYTMAENGLNKGWGGAKSILQSTIFKHIRMGCQVLRGRSQGKHACCYVDSSKDRYKIFSRLHFE